MSELSMLQNIVEVVYERHLKNNTGSVATYIPELAKAEPDHFGIAIATVDNGLATAGDVDVDFSLQSLSKPFAFGMALDIWGDEKTLKHVGTEPSGEAFNSIELDPGTRRPFNPMVNAGAISMTSLINEKFHDKSESEIVELFSKLASEKLSIDECVYQSEIKTADRNRALTYLMKSVDVIQSDAEKSLGLYTRQCSINVNARQLAIMAASLANIGNNPVTDENIYTPFTVRKILSVMFTCGMYDSAGQWAVDVGIPAKSGVSGGLMAVVNRQIGIGIFSPRLDAHGNSVRAIAACIDLAEELGLHAFEFSNQGSSILDVYLKEKK